MMFPRIDESVINGHQLSTQLLREGVNQQCISGWEVTPDHLEEFDIWSTCDQHMVDIGLGEIYRISGLRIVPGFHSRKILAPFLTLPPCSKNYPGCPHPFS